MPSNTLLTKELKEKIKQITIYFLSLESNIMKEELRTNSAKDVRRIKTVITRFSTLDDERLSILTHSLCLLNRVLRLNPPEFKKGDLFKIFVVLISLSFKFLDDELTLLIEDVSLLSGLKEKMIKELEIGLLVSVLRFRVFVEVEEFKSVERELKGRD